MNPDAIQTEFIPFFRLYKSGRVERLEESTFVPPSLSPNSEGVSTKDVVISPHVSARLYLPKLPSNNNHENATKLPVVVYYHGGAFCVQSAFSSLYHPHVSTLSARAHALVVSVEYRLAPEHPLPAAHDDAWAALRWAAGPGSDEWLERHGDAGRVFLAGDSAGASLSHYAASVAAASRPAVPVAGIVLVHPYFGLLGVKAEVWEAMSAMDIDDPRHNPMANGGKGTRELPRGTKVFVAVAAEDALRVNGIEYVESLEKSGWGGEAVMVETAEEGHVFHLFKHGKSDKAEELMERVVRFINGS